VTLVKPDKDKPLKVGKLRALINRWENDTTDEIYERVASFLNVKVSALKKLHCCWAPEYGALAFPMRDGNGQLCGIRLRSMTGRKWTVKGSHEGIFLPDTNPDRTVYIVEGPTDTAAALSIKLYAIGRPSCLGGTEILLSTIKRLNISRVVIVADKDKPGIAGALKMSAQLHVPHVVIALPDKDMRDYVAHGGTAHGIQQIVSTQQWIV